MDMEFDLRKFVAPEFIFGFGALELVGQYAANLGARKVLLVSDPGVVAAGWAEKVLVSLRAVGLHYAVFSDVTPNPKSKEVMAGAQYYQQEGCNFIVSVGGGSSIDCAKGIGIVSSNRRRIHEFSGVDQVPIPGPPLLCIPTTAGSSADVSQFAIISDEAEGIKMAIISKTVVPDVALIDPLTTTTMDAYLTATTGMDALTHAIEAYVSVAHSPITDLHALEAIRLVTQFIQKSVAELDNITWRAQMMLGSLHAGLAFSNASLGAVHAMSHSLGGLSELAHGVCNTLLLYHVIDFNFETVSERYRDIGVAMGLDIKESPEKQVKARILEEISRLQKAVGFEDSLKTLGVERASISKLAHNAMLDACMVTNPRRPTQRDIEMIYEKAF